MQTMIVEGDTAVSPVNENRLSRRNRGNGTNRLSKRYDNSYTPAIRDDILKQLFGDVGDLIDDFSCAVESPILLHGRMYITKRFLCFYSNLFGLEKKIRIPFSHMKDITKENTALVIPNAICVTTYRKDSTKEYVFRSFWDRDDCFRILSEVYETAKLLSPEGSWKTSYSRRSTDNIPKRVINRKSGETTQRRAAEKVNRLLNASAESNASVDLERSFDAVADVALSAEDVARPSLISDLGEGRDSVLWSNQAAESLLERPSDIYSNLDDSALVPEDSEDGFEESELRSGHISTDDDPTEDLEPIFRAEVASKRLKLKVVDVDLPVSVQEYYDLFLADEAPYSGAKYYEGQKSTNIKCVPWEKYRQTSVVETAGREMKFVKPLPVSSTRCTNVQQCRRFGEVGLIVCSSTSMEDVPAAGTFTVDDTLTLSASAASPFNTHIEITYEIKFVKSTMLKYMIESRTDVEMTKWFKDLQLHLVTVCRHELPRLQLARPPSAANESSGGVGGGVKGGAAAAGAPPSTSSRSSLHRGEQPISSGSLLSSSSSDLRGGGDLVQRGGAKSDSGADARVEGGKGALAGSVAIAAPGGFGWTERWLWVALVALLCCVCLSMLSYIHWHLPVLNRVDRRGDELTELVKSLVHYQQKLEQRLIDVDREYRELLIEQCLGVKEKSFAAS